jgi:hypothetical protein
MVKSGMRWVENAADTRGIRKAQKISVVKPKGRRQLEETGHR